MRRRPIAGRTALRRGLLAGTAGLVFAAGIVDAAPPAQSGPVLAIGAVSAPPAATVSVPITFKANGHAISTLLFSIDFDAAVLTLDPTDADNDGIPDAVSIKLPAGLTAMVTLDTGDTDSELDVLVTGLKAPLPTVPDGTVAVVTFRPKPGAAPSGAETTVRFASTPLPSFGSTAGQSVPGTATAGTVRWGTGSAGPTATPAAGSGAMPARGSTAPPSASPTLATSRDRGRLPAAPAATRVGGSGASAVQPPATGAAGAGAIPGDGAAAVPPSGDPMATIAALAALSAGDEATVPTSELPTNVPLESGDTGNRARATLPNQAAPTAVVAAVPPDRPREPAQDGSSGGRGWLPTVVTLAVLGAVVLAYRRWSGGALRSE